MKVAVPIEISDSPSTCKFAKKCLEEFDSSLCCDIQREGSNFLFVSPVSTFKSTNCSYNRRVKKDEEVVHICTCPIRLEIFRNYHI